ncbi:MAG: hypothetical protein SCARUB_02487 [Candidatus Scalindua rubra]|uniref:Uncharacterized protein n=1 Tax=Candidatus Scalindua rubra TaxID=1872076 RepID=A0A1E3X9R4_9BACT|nr:MAG: hypothetical protein SCARUB_02487 [Candidatus Scalindua rubra]
MDKVVFTHLENTDDIIISLSCEEGSAFGVDGFTIQRTPKYEFIYSPDERGACIEWDESDDIRVLLDEVYLDRKELKIKTKGKIREYHFNIEEIPDDEYEALIKHFHLINFDNSIKIEIG